MAYIHQINQFDIDNDFGQGPVVSVFFNFCSFHCKGCWNESTWARKEELYWENEKAADVIIAALQKLKERGMKPNLSLLGGDPIVPENIEDTKEIIERIRSEIPDVTICSWTGFDVEDWWRKEGYDTQKDLLKQLDYVVDGRFIHRLKTKNQMFGSINQRVIDTKKLLELSSTQPLKEAILHSLAYPDVEIIVIDAPGYKTTPRQLMENYLRKDNRSRLYQLSVLHHVADFKKGTTNANTNSTR